MRDMRVLLDVTTSFTERIPHRSADCRRRSKKAKHRKTNDVIKTFAIAANPIQTKIPLCKFPNLKLRIVNKLVSKTNVHPLYESVAFDLGLDALVVDQNASF